MIPSPTDPRLNSLVQFTQNAATGASQAGVVGLLRAELADQAQRIAALERTATIQEVAGTPTSAPRNGTPAVDTSAPKLWIRRNGTWQFATLT